MELALIILVAVSPFITLLWSWYVEDKLQHDLHMKELNLISKKHVTESEVIERLREWIHEEGERNDVCTYNILGKVCGYCECKRKEKMK